LHPDSHTSQGIYEADIEAKERFGYTPKALKAGESGLMTI
jgi:hypothetical protein